MLERAPLRPGDSVLDVATGSGVVARLAAGMVGESGRVVASDISPAMLAVAASKAVVSDVAAIAYLECSASAIAAEADTFDAVLCQQGLQFFPDRTLALREMGRVTRPGGTVVVATWAAERPLGLFGPMAEAFAAAGVEEPYPGAFDHRSYCLSIEQIHADLSDAGLHDPVIETVTLTAAWPDIDHALATVLGTPFGPLFAASDPPTQGQILGVLADHLGVEGNGAVHVETTSHIGVATAST
jgi:SAM-dependent methyltransferase